MIAEFIDIIRYHELEKTTEFDVREITHISDEIFLAYYRKRREVIHSNK